MENQEPGARRATRLKSQESQESQELGVPGARSKGPMARVGARHGVEEVRWEDRKTFYLKVKNQQSVGRVVC